MCDAQVFVSATRAGHGTAREPVDKGGWSCLMTALSGVDMLDPAVQTFLRGNGDGAGYGWVTSPDLERLRDAWIDAPDLEAQQRVAADIQRRAFQDVPYVPAGQFFLATATSNRLT